MQQRQQADEALVGMGVGVGGPAEEQPALFGDAEDLRTRSSVAIGGDAHGGVDQHDAVGFGPAEEEPQCAQATGPTERPLGQERLDIARLGAGPVALGAVVDHEAGQVANDGEVFDDGEVGAGPSPGPSGALLTGYLGVGEAAKCRPKRFGGLIDPPPLPAGPTLGLVVEWEGQAGIDEEALQRAGQRGRGGTMLAGALQDSLGVGRSRLGEHAAETADHQRRTANAVAGRRVVDEVGEPRWRVLQPGGDPFRLTKEPFRVFLPAQLAQAPSHNDNPPSTSATGAVGLRLAVTSAASNPIEGTDRRTAVHTHPRDHRGGMDRPRATFGGWREDLAGLALGVTGVMSTSRRSLGLHSSAVHNATSVASFTCDGVLVNNAETDAEDSSSPARSASSRRN